MGNQSPEGDYWINLLSLALSTKLVRRREVQETQPFLLESKKNKSYNQNAAEVFSPRFGYTSLFL